MKTTLSSLAFVAGLTLSCVAQAGPWVSVGGTAIPNEGQTTSAIAPVSMSILDFNVSSITPTNLTITGSASNFVTGSLANQYAAPPNDLSQYISVSPAAGSPFTVTVSDFANYLGFYAGSIDGYNAITLTGVSGSITYTGSDLASMAGITANGDQSIGYYYNVYLPMGFSSVTFTSSANAFEIDNVAIGNVPVPGTVALLGLGLLGAAAARRRAK
jgi:hypothetical protein